MATYRMEMIETRTYLVSYIVEAKNEDEAQELAEIGSTLAEEEIKMLDVVNREVIEFKERSTGDRIEITDY